MTIFLVFTIVGSCLLHVKPTVNIEYAEPYINKNHTKIKKKLFQICNLLRGIHVCYCGLRPIFNITVQQ